MASLDSFVIVAPACDLCETPTAGTLYWGEPLGLEGRVCGGCREDILAENACLQRDRLKLTPYVPLHEKQHHRLFLDVLDARFTLDDLTPKANARLLLRDPTTRRVFGVRRHARGA